MAELREALNNAGKTLLLSLVGLVAIMVPMFIPGDFFLRVERLELYPAGTVIPDLGITVEEDTVLQSRQPFDWWGGITLNWNAAVVRLDFRAEDAEDFLNNVCQGPGGTYFYRPQEMYVPPSLDETLPERLLTKPKLLLLDTWLGAPCQLKPGGTYRLYGQWTFEWGGLWSWTVDRFSPPVVIEERREAADAKDP